MRTRNLAIFGLSLAAMVLTMFAAERPFRRSALPAEIKNALVEALAGPDGEYAAHAEYSAIIDKFGEVQPYVNIRMAESRHIAALKRQMQKYGIQIPENKFEGVLEAPETLLDAAKEGVAAEQLNIAMYERLLGAVQDYPDLVRVFTNLQRASRDAHLPAFTAALENEGQLDSVTGTCPGCDAGSCCQGGSAAQNQPRGRQNQERGRR